MRLIQRVFSVAALLAAIVVLAGGLALYSGNLRLQVVTSGSMRPTVSPGDVAVTTPIPVDALAVGDVIAFFPPGQSTPVLHRLVAITADAQGTAITTKGDANRVVDPWHAYLRGNTAYRLVGVVPLIGWLVPYRGAVLILSGLLLLIGLLRQLRKERLSKSIPAMTPD